MLTATRITHAKSKAKAYKLTDGLGLYLLITPAGGKLWRMKYRFASKEKALAFGAFPDIGLQDAREARDAARKLLAKGIDPGEDRKAKKAAQASEEGFEAVAREWHEKYLGSWSPGYAEMVLARLVNDVFPWLGSRPCREISAPDALKVLRRVEDRGAIDIAHRTKTICSQVFRYAIATGRAERDPAADLRGALTPKMVKHYSAITEPKAVAALLRAVDGYEGSFVVRCALQLAALLMVRPGELRHMEWTELNFDTATWVIPAAKMKMKNDHIVPLCPQAVAILLELKPLTGRGRYVMPSHRSTTRAMSENAVLGALRRMGYAKTEMSGHGFRAMARTILDEVLHVRVEYIEHQLAHTVRDPNGRAYNRTAHLDERRKMMHLWADYLDGLRVGADVVSITKAG